MRRPSNYGSRIDYILCSPGLRPWIKGGDIQNKVFGSDHCPVYIDLHDSITLDSGEVLHIRDQLNPSIRPILTVPSYPTDPPRTAPEPPRFATKFLDEFSGKQQTLKSFFGGGTVGRKKSGSMVSASPTPTPASAAVSVPVKEDESMATDDGRSEVPSSASKPSIEAATPFGLARAAFESIDDKPSVNGNGNGHGTNAQASGSRPPKPSTRQVSIDLTADDDKLPARSPTTTTSSQAPKPANSQTSTSAVTQKKAAKATPGSQMKLSNFFQQPPNKAKRKASASATPTSETSTSIQSKRAVSSPMIEGDGDGHDDLKIPSQDPDPEEEALIAQALAEADADREERRAEQKAKVTPKWNELFAKKLPPLCTIHQKPCKDFSE